MAYLRWGLLDIWLYKVLAQSPVHAVLRRVDRLEQLGLGLELPGLLGFSIGRSIFGLGNDHSLCTCQQHIILQIPLAHSR